MTAAGLGIGNGHAANGIVNGAGAGGKVRNPLNGLVPRKVQVDQAKAIMVSELVCIAECLVCCAVSDLSF